jgi:hypothetical protein
MSRIVTQTVYGFSELSDTAKEKAMDWFRNGMEFYVDDVLDDAKEVAKILGIDIRHIYYSGFYSQGDGACFEGTYEYRKGSGREIREFAPHDTALHTIAEELQECQRQHFYRLAANVRQRGFYQHSGCTTIHVTDKNSGRDTENSGIEQTLREFMDWIYKSLETEWDYQNSEECVTENILANAYEFLENGERA